MQQLYTRQYQRLFQIRLNYNSLPTVGHSNTVVFSKMAVFFVAASHVTYYSQLTFSYHAPNGEIILNMAAGVTDGNILYDYFIHAEWSLGGEILVSFNFFSAWECLEFFVSVLKDLLSCLRSGEVNLLRGIVASFLTLSRL